MNLKAFMNPRKSLGVKVTLCLCLLLFRAAAVGSLGWPYQPMNQTHGIGNHYGEYQRYPDPPEPYYHDGLDLVTPEGPTRVYSVSDGTVTNITVDPEDPDRYSGIMIGEPWAGGTGWLYWHIDPTTFQFNVGQPVPQGAYIGTTARWLVADFHHVHFSRVQGTDDYPWYWYTAIDNPLLYLEPRTDPDPPVFETTYAGRRFAFGRNNSSTLLDPTALSGDVDIISRIKDIVGMPQWALNPWKITYWINGATQSVPVTNAVTFSGPIPPDETVGVIYRTTAPLQSRGDYMQRKFYFIVTNTDGDGMVESGDADYSWQTDLFNPGDYWVYVRAADIGGNVVTDSMVCTIAGTTNSQVNLPETYHNFGRVPPDSTVTWDMTVQNLGTDYLSIREITSTLRVYTVDRSHFYVPPGGETIVRVFFRPRGTIWGGCSPAFPGSLWIKTNDRSHPLLEVKLRGWARIPGNPSPPTAGGAAARAFGLRGTRVIPQSGLEVSYALDRPGTVVLDIFDLAGRWIRGTEMQSVAAGLHTWRWNGTDASGRTMPSGVYFVRFRSGTRTSSIRTVLLR